MTIVYLWNLGLARFCRLNCCWTARSYLRHDDDTFKWNRFQVVNAPDVF
jgi:hypothetical protein